MPKLIKINKHRSSLATISSNTVGVGTLSGIIPSPTTESRRVSAAAATTSAVVSYSSSVQHSHQQQPIASAGGKRLSLESSTSKQVKRWDERFDELVKFKVLYGSCRVPHRYPDNPGLSRWVVYMRSSYQAGNLPTDRIEKLNQIGFIWSDRGHTAWDKRLQQLEEYKATHGTTRVSCDTPESAQLWRWSSVQRANYRLGKLSADRIRALDELGFIWDVDQHDWDCKYDDLADFYAAHRHTRLPNKEPYKKLFLWARVQRTKYHDKSLSTERVAKLQKLDFGWEKNSMYTTSTGHVTMDAGEDGSQQCEVASSPLSCGATCQVFDHHPPLDGSYSATRLIPISEMAKATVTVTSAALGTNHSFQGIPRVSGVKSPPPLSNESSGGFDRLLQLAELARQFSPVPVSPVRPFRP